MVNPPLALYRQPGSQPLYTYPVQSAIAVPEPDANVTIKDHQVEVKGYAYAGGGRRILRVEVTVDNGANWTLASLEQQVETSIFRSYTWTIWTAMVDVSELVKKGDSTATFRARAMDVGFNSQPDDIGQIWNYRGVTVNSQHRVNVNLV